MKKQRKTGAYIGSYHLGYVRGWWKFPYDLYREIKSFIHRGWYGWSPSDTWSFDYYIIPILSEVGQFIKDESHHDREWCRKNHGLDLDYMIEIAKLHKKAVDEMDHKEAQKHYKEVEKRLHHFADNYHCYWW